MPRSCLPRGLAIQSGTSLCGRLGRRIEQGEKSRVCVVVKKEHALLEDCLLSLSARALAHELGQLLPAQRRCSIEKRLCFRGSADLNHVVLTSSGCGHGQTRKYGQLGIVLTFSTQYPRVRRNDPGHRSFAPPEITRFRAPSLRSVPGMTEPSV